MSAGFGMTQIVDGVIVFTLLEGLALVLYHRSTGRGVALRDFLANMASGLCLMLALRFAVTDAGAASIALCLLGAGLAHATDLWLRGRRSARAATASRRVIA